MTFEQETQNLIDDFIGRLTDLWRRHAIASLTGVSPTGSSARRASAKRTGNELDGLATAFAEFVAKNPGLRIEQINKKLGTKTSDLRLPIRKLLADGVIKAKGAKRSTTYFAR